MSQTKNVQEAVLAGGCFWGVEELFRQLQGILSTEVGYTGGKTNNPTYEDVKTGQTGHAEALRILFDPQQISYSEILDFFFTMHDPTYKNQQGHDVGSQYRSAIFFMDEGQQAEAQQVIAKVDRSGFWPRPVVTELEAFQVFYSAEDYHQKYLQKNPDGYTCHYVRVK